MADVVNATHKERLAQRNSEPSHIAGAVSYEDIGGNPSVDAEPNSAKVDGAKGVSTDTSIPKSVPAEKTHLGRVTGSEAAEEADDVEISFDGAEQGTDDIDTELDSFEDVEPVDVDVEVDDKDEKDEKEVKESRRVRGRRLHEDEGSDTFTPEGPGSEGDGERGDSASAVRSNMSKPESDMNSGTNTVKEDENPFAKKDDDDEEKLDEEGESFGGDDNPDAPKKNAAEPDAVLNKKDGSSKVEEAFRIRITMPKANLFESAGVAKKDVKRVQTVFESVVKDVTKQIGAQLHKRYKTLHEQKLARRDAVLAKQIDGYLNYVVEEWMGKNKVAVRTSLRAQLAEDFLSGLQTLFTEHYIDVPASKVDVVKQLTKQVSTLKKSLNEQVEKKLKLRRLAEAANKARHIAEFASNAKLSEAQSAKLRKLAENTQYVNAADFKDKLTMLSESYFGGDKKPKSTAKPLAEAAQPGDFENGKPVVADKSDAPAIDPLVKAAMAASVALDKSKNDW